MGLTFVQHFDKIAAKERDEGVELRDNYHAVSVTPGERRTLRSHAEGLWAPIEMIACVSFGALRDVEHSPDLIRPKPSGSDDLLREPSVATLFPEMPRPARLALSAGLLQIYDFWDASHAAAQEADDLGEKKVSAYWHAIAHRREPDPGNASYWFRRVGRHPVFERLAEEARPILNDHPDLAARLLPRGGWDPFAFIEVCTRPKANQAKIAREIQRIEMLLLLEASLPQG